MKNFLLLLLSLLFIAGCSSSNVPETNEKQIERLLKEAENREKEKEKNRMQEVKEIPLEMEQIKVQDLDEVEEGMPDSIEIDVAEEKWVAPHKDKTRGEIMEYEMQRIKSEMESLQTSVNDYAQKSKLLKEYKEKLEKLEKLNEAAIK